MVVKVRFKLNGNVTYGFINPMQYLYAEQGNRGDVFLFNANSDRSEGVNYDDKVNKDKKPLILSMTLDELAELPGFIKVMVKSRATSEIHPVVICEHAIKYARPFIQKDANKPLFVLYIVGTNNSTITLYTEEDISSKLGLV